MFGPKISQVFKSRWHALYWSAGILVTAYCSIPSPDDSDSQKQDQAVSSEQSEAAQQAMSAWNKVNSGQ